jgi:hypothetical protein
MLQPCPEIKVEKAATTPFGDGDAGGGCACVRACVRACV